MAEGLFHPNCTHRMVAVPEVVAKEYYTENGEEKAEKDVAWEKHLAHQEKRKKQREQAKENRTKREAEFIGAELIKGEHSIEDDLKAVNPNFTEGRDGVWENNCQRCIVAYELRRRGIDVKAMPCLEDEIAESKFRKNWYKFNGNAKWIFQSISGANNRKNYIIQKMKEFGKESRATIYIDYGDDGAHVFSVENINDEIIFIDPQTGECNVDYLFHMQKSNLFGIARVDNLKIDDYIKGVVEVNR